MTLEEKVNELNYTLRKKAIGKAAIFLGVVAGSLGSAYTGSLAVIKSYDPAPEPFIINTLLSMGLIISTIYLASLYSNVKNNKNYVQPTQTPIYNNEHHEIRPEEIA